MFTINFDFNEIWRNTMIKGTPNDSLFLNQRRYKDNIESGICKREAFQRDRDRIMHSRAFRRMMHKTQIFNANMGDHFRNRLTHTLEVCQIARSIGKALCLNDELIEAIALGHDLGHTPFGHIGERTLHEIIMNGALSEETKINQGFKHNLQSLRVVDELESRCSAYTGLNLTLAVREGILKHTSTKKDGKLINFPEADFTNMDLESPSFTLEGQVVALADEIAQCTHDIEDGVRSRIISFSTISGDPFVQKVISESGISLDTNTKNPAYDTRSLIIKNMVGFFIKDACITSVGKIEKYISEFSPSYSSLNTCIREKCVMLSPETESNRQRIYKDMIVNRVICSEQISISDSKSEYIIKQLFKAFFNHPKQLPDYVLEKYCTRSGLEFNRANLDITTIKKDPKFIRTICDHIAGMTDQFAAREYYRLYVPEYK